MVLVTARVLISMVLLAKDSFVMLCNYLLYESHIEVILKNDIFICYNITSAELFH